MPHRLIPFLRLTAVLAAPLLTAGGRAAPHQPSTLAYSQDRWKS